MNLVIRLLQLLLILPSGRSKILDMLGLLLWSGLCTALAVAFSVYEKDRISKLYKTYDMYAFYSIAQAYLNPTMILVVTVPAIHFIVSNSTITFKKDETAFNSKIMFCLDMLLNVLALATNYHYILQFKKTSFERHAILFTVFTTCHLLMALSTFTLGFVMSQLRNNRNMPFGTDLTSQKLEEFVSLKSGCSPLIFTVYAVKVLYLLFATTSLLTAKSFAPNWMTGAMFAYAAFDIAYINIVTTDAYDYIQSLIIKLRYLKPFNSVPNACVLSNFSVKDYMKPMSFC